MSQLTHCSDYSECFMKVVGLSYFFAGIYTLRLVETNEFIMLMKCEYGSF
jgi:hypothetical protein